MDADGGLSQPAVHFRRGMSRGYTREELIEEVSACGDEGGVGITKRATPSEATSAKLLSRQ